LRTVNKLCIFFLVFSLVLVGCVRVEPEIQERKISFLEKFNALDAENLPGESIIVEIADQQGPLRIEMKRTELEGRTVIVPAQGQNCPAEYNFSFDGSKTFLRTVAGLWLVETDGTLRTLVFEENRYRELREEYIKRFQSDGLLWIGPMLVNETGSRVIYTSDRNTWEKCWVEIFCYDLTTGKEILFSEVKAEQILLEGWLNEEQFLCTALTENARRLLLLEFDGSVTELQAESKFPSVYDVCGNRIAYAAHLSSSEVYIGEVTEDLKLKTLYFGKLGESTRLRPGKNGFDPSAKSLQRSWCRKMIHAGD